MCEFLKRREGTERVKKGNSGINGLRGANKGENSAEAKDGRVWQKTQKKVERDKKQEAYINVLNGIMEIITQIGQMHIHILPLTFPVLEYFTNILSILH